MNVVCRAYPSLGSTLQVPGIGAALNSILYSAKPGVVELEDCPAYEMGKKHGNCNEDPFCKCHCSGDLVNSVCIGYTPP